MRLLAASIRTAAHARRARLFGLAKRHSPCAGGCCPSRAQRAPHSRGRCALDALRRGLDAARCLQVRQRTSRLPALSSLSGLRVSPLSFEKDDDTNFHMDFIRSFANLRARNYSIEEVDALQVLSAEAFSPAPRAQTRRVCSYLDLAQLADQPTGPRGPMRPLNDGSSRAGCHATRFCGALSANRILTAAGAAQAKLIAGRIIPALATTTSMVARPAAPP